MGKSSVVVGLGNVGIEGDNLDVICQGCVIVFKSIAGIPPVIVGVDILGIEDDGLRVIRYRAFLIPLGIAGIPSDVIGCSSGIEGDGLGGVGNNFLPIAVR